MKLRHLPLSLALLTGLSTPALAADDSAAQVLRIIGDFVLDGLGPAKTADDIMREERERAARKLEEARRAEAAQEARTEPQPTPIDDQTVKPPVQAAVPPDPVGSPPREKAAEPAIPTVQPPAPPPPKPVAVASVVSNPPPPAVKAEPVSPTARPAFVKAPPKPIVLPPEKPPEILSSRIAATATVTQALRLGGRPSLYGTANKPQAVD